MSHISDKRRQPRDLVRYGHNFDARCLTTHASNVEAKMFASNRFENIVDDWFLFETYADGLNVRKIGHKFQPDTHRAAKRYILKAVRNIQ